VQELRLRIDCAQDVEPQLAALASVQKLSALTKLELDVWSDGGDPVSLWPPFIPPSLKALRIDSQYEVDRTALESLLCALPGMLGASGARLERLEVILPWEFKATGDELVHLAQALRCCSPTLNGLLLSTGIDDAMDGDHFGDYNEFEARLERLRVQWADFLAAVSACRELQVLVLPRIEVEPLFPPGTAFGRLTHLDISDHERVRGRVPV
jgi:hypothetical protein